MTGISQAVILAGGRGERLRPITDTMPKPMVPINGQPFLTYLVELLKNNGIKEIVMLLGYMPEKITEYFGDGAKFGIKIKYSATGVEDETGTRIKKAGVLLKKDFLLLYCDNYWPLNLKKLIALYNEKGVPAMLTAYTNKFGITKNNLLTGANGIVLKYDKSRSDASLNAVDIGFFLLNSSILKLMPDYNFSFEKEILPKLVSSGELAAFSTDHRYYSIGSVDRLPVTAEFLSNKKVVFLDRDGVINEKPPKAEYVKTWGEFKFLPGVIEALQILAKKGYQLYIVTNQAGVDRGIMSENALAEIHKRLNSELVAYGVKLSGIYSCPHSWDAGCDCRKPKAGMFFKAAHDHHIDLSKAVFIGDDERDLQAGEAAGCRTILTRQGFGLLEISKELQ